MKNDNEVWTCEEIVEKMLDIVYNGSSFEGDYWMLDPFKGVVYTSNGEKRKNYDVKLFVDFDGQAVWEYLDEHFEKYANDDVGEYRCFEDVDRDDLYQAFGYFLEPWYPKETLSTLRAKRRQEKKERRQKEVEDRIFIIYNAKATFAAANAANILLSDASDEFQYEMIRKQLSYECADALFDAYNAGHRSWNYFYRLAFKYAKRWKEDEEK